jgi:hypothetical protein
MLLSESQQQPKYIQAEKNKSDKHFATLNGEDSSSNEKQKKEMLLKLEAKLEQLENIESTKNSNYILSRKS